MMSPVVNFQRTAPVFWSKAWTSWFHDPTYSRPFAPSVGAELTNSSTSEGGGGGVTGRVGRVRLPSPALRAPRWACAGARPGDQQDEGGENGEGAGG